MINRGVVPRCCAFFNNNAIAVKAIVRAINSSIPGMNIGDAMAILSPRNRLNEWPTVKAVASDKSFKKLVAL